MDFSENELRALRIGLHIAIEEMSAIEDKTVSKTLKNILQLINEAIRDMELSNG